MKRHKVADRINSGRGWIAWSVIGIFVSSISVATFAILWHVSGFQYSFTKTDAGVSETVVDENAVQLLGINGAHIFKSLDLDGNGLLSYSEFGPVVETLTGEAPPVTAKKTDEDPGETVVLNTDFLPIKFETMKMYEDEGVEGLMRNFKHMTGLRGWTSPYRAEEAFVSRDFGLFIPRIGDNVVGKAYWLYNPQLEPWHRGDSGKYYPPVPSFKEELLFRLLRMFHPRPFLLTRFGPHGVAAVVQAYNEEFYLIRFRIHCEFQLNEPPLYPFWYTPAQMSGSLVVSKDGKRLNRFDMKLPNDRKLNIDMEWITQLGNASAGESEQMEVEIGFQPKMEVHLINPEEISILWTQEISDSEADSILEKKFYPFKQVTYHPPAEVYDRAAAESKLIHSIILWGSLDDQSC